MLRNPCNIYQLPMSLSNLHSACETGDSDLVQFLIEQSPELVNQPGLCGRAALSWAALRGQTEVGRLLMKAGADPELRESNQTRWNGFTAERIACNRGHEGFASMLSSWGEDQEEEEEEEDSEKEEETEEGEEAPPLGPNGEGGYKLPKVDIGHWGGGDICYPRSFCVSPDGSCIVTTGQKLDDNDMFNGRTAIWDGQSGEIRYLLNCGQTAWGGGDTGHTVCAISPDSGKLAVRSRPL